MILWQQTNTKLNRKDLLSLSTIKFCDVQPTTYLLVNLSAIDYCSICISYTGFAFSVFSLTHWCSCHIHHQIRCCVVLLSGTIWRYGCEKAVRFIKHNNIFQQYHLLLTSSHCGGGLIVVCVAICIANLLVSELLTPRINSVFSLRSAPSHSYQEMT